MLCIQTTKVRSSFECAERLAQPADWIMSVTYNDDVMPPLLTRPGALQARTEAIMENVINIQWWPWCWIVLCPTNLLCAREYLVLDGKFDIELDQRARRIWNSITISIRWAIQVPSCFACWICAIDLTQNRRAGAAGLCSWTHEEVSQE